MFWNKRYDIDELKKFYRNELVNAESMYLSDMWHLSYKEMEVRHDYIQWLFPIDKKSNYNRKAPVLTVSDIEVLKEDAVIMDNFVKSVHIFLHFLGLELLADNTIRLSLHFESRKQNWLRPRNHNYKRVTRLLTFLILFGFDDIAENLMAVLDRLYEENKEKIGEVTYNYWKAAFSQE